MTSSPVVAVSASARSFCDAASQSESASGVLVLSTDRQDELEAGVSALCLFEAHVRDLELVVAKLGARVRALPEASE